MTTAELAYLAGIVDGEGCLGIYGKSIRIKSGISRVFKLQFEVTSTSPELIAWLMNVVGGRYTARKRDGHRRHKQDWGWELSVREVKPVCRSLLPFLVVKRRQAEILLEYPEFDGRNRSDRIGYAAALRKRESLYQETLMLNSRNGQ